MASAEEVIAEVRSILRVANLEETTGRQVRQQLQAKLGVPVDEHKQLISAEIQAFLAENGNSPRPSKRKGRSSGEGANQEEEGEPPRKVPKLNDDHLLEVLLEDPLFLIVRTFNGRKLIDLRSHYKKDGHYKPAKGVTLNLSEYKTLCQNADNLKKALDDEDEDLIVELGCRKRRAKISTFKGVKIDVRDYYDKEGETRPTNKGCLFSVSALDILVESLPKVELAWGEDDPPPPIPNKGKEPMKSSQEYVFCKELGPKSQVSVSSWKGAMRVDLRETYEKDGQKLLSKKGISLTIDQWEKVKDEVHAITAAYEASTEGFSVGIGPRRSIRVGLFRGKPFIDLREFYEKNGQEMPGRAGMRFHADTWQKLKDNMGKIDRALEGHE